MATLNGKQGVWRTVGGRRIFIADGEDLETAMRNSGKFNISLDKLNEKYKSILLFPIEKRKNRVYSDDNKSKYNITYKATIDKKAVNYDTNIEIYENSLEELDKQLSYWNSKKDE